MNPKGLPKRLDSGTGCLRITVPENLDLALEGLIRKVLREQPKTDDIYAFAANYFETLLRIRDKAGAEYTTTQLCPFHNDEEAREMIVLAGTFPRQVPGGVQGKGIAPLKTEAKKETDKAEPEKGLKRSKETLKDSSPEAEQKQATPDLIKKLPLLAQNEGSNVEEAKEKTTEAGPDPERTETAKEGGDEEEYLTSDPIKEFVEKELLMEERSKEEVAKGDAPEPSEGDFPSPTAREGQNEESEGGVPSESNAVEKKRADGRDNSGATDVVDGVIHASEDGGKWNTDPKMRETDSKGVEARDVTTDAKDKIGGTAQPEAEGERPLQETQQEKEKEEETNKLRSEEESQNKMESAAETEAEPEGLEAPLSQLSPSPVASEKHAQEVVHMVSPGYNMEADVSPELEGGKITQNAAYSEVASFEEKGIAEIGGVQQPTEDKSENDAQPSTASAMKTNEESPETSSLVTNTNDSKHENDEARAAEGDKSQISDRIEAINGETESIAWDEGEARDLTTEAGSSPERAKGGASVEEEGLHQSKGGESNKGTDNQDADVDDPSKPGLKSTEEEAKLTSQSALEAELATELSLTGAEDPTGEPGQRDGGSEILKQEQLPHSHVTGSETETESKGGDEEGKAGGGKKLSDEEVKAKDQSVMGRGESLKNRTSPEELLLQKTEDIQCTAEAPTEDADGRHAPLTGVSSTTEGPESEGQGDAKQEAPRNRSSPTSDAGNLRGPGGTPEIAIRETEGTPTAKNETASLANEELCSVVDINHVKGDGGNQEGPKPAKLRPENTAEEKSAPGPEGSPSPSLSSSAPNGETWRENQNEKPSLQQEFVVEDATQGKAESEELPNHATVIPEPVKSEIDKEKGDAAEGRPPYTREGFDSSAEGKQIIIVEESETTRENPDESSPSGEIQIKTIQTHYYDTLRVPETVTREYRVHEVAAPTIDGLLGAASPPPSTKDEVQESPGDEGRFESLTDDNAVPPTPKNSPTSDGDVSQYAEAAEAQSHVGPPHYPSHVGADELLTVDGSDRDAQVSDSDDFPHLTTPTSDVSSNLAELSLQAVSETFLTSEKRFSSLEKEEIGFVNPTTEARRGEPEGRVVESGREIDEGGDETVLPSTAGIRPAPPTPGASTEGAEDVKEDGERPAGSSGGSPALSDGRAANGDSPTDPASEKSVSEPRLQGEDERGADAPGPPSEHVRGRTASGVESPEKESVHLLQKSQQRNVLESCPEELQAGSGCDGRPDSRSAGRTGTEPAGEASYAETDSTTSSATTEMKRADSAKRDFACARTLTSARSLDFGKRNPLLRTRSLSSHRHGVADFEVWSTIEKELEEAATKIQSKFRGYNTRKKLRREVAVQISTEESSKRSTPVEAEDADNGPRATGEFHDGIVLPDHPR